MQAIILSAGRGSRLKKYLSHPKCLLKIKNGKTLIERIISMLKQQKIDDIHVVTGFKSKIIKKVLRDKVKYHYFKNYSSCNNLQTLLSVKKLLNKKSLILFSDIIFEEEILNGILKKRQKIVLGITTNKILKNTMRIKIKKNYIRDIGNQIKPNNANGNFIGIAKFSKSSIILLKKYLLRNKLEKKDYYTKAIIDMIQDGIKVSYFITNRFFWKEFDTIKDLGLLKRIKYK